MRAKEERKQREELEATLRLLEKKTFSWENQCLCDKCERDLEELYDNMKNYVSEAGVSSIKEVQNPLNFS